MTLEERIQMVKDATGYEEEDRPVEKFEGWTYGDRAVVIEGDDDHGLYEGDEGYIVISKVGAPKYGNVRTYIGLLIDDTDSPTEVRDVLSIEPA